MAQNVLPDVLFEIFQRCLPSDMSNASVTTSPANLSQVCRSWRDVALEQTSLWATLKLRHDGFDDVHPETAEGAWKLWLRRSATAPLTVDIFSNRLLDGDDEESFAKIVGMTFAEQHRWKDVHIWCNSFTTNPSQPLLLKTSPHLESLGLRNHMPLSALPGCSHNEIILDLSENTSSIRTLSLGGAISLSPTVGFMPNLHSLDIQAHCASPSSPALTIQDLFKILSSAPSLALLYASLIFTVPDVDFLPAVTLPHLRHFKLSICGFAEHLFNAVICPALEELHISFLDELSNSRETWVAIADMLSRSLSLRHLTLYSNTTHYNAPRREDHILSILRQAPSLLSMFLQGQYISDKLIAALKLEPGASTYNVCPGLESMTFACKREHDVTAGCMGDMLWSRICPFGGRQEDMPLCEVVLGLQEFEYAPSIEACLKSDVKLTISK